MYASYADFCKPAFAGTSGLGMGVEFHLASNPSSRIAQNVATSSDIVVMNARSFFPAYNLCHGVA